MGKYSNLKYNTENTPVLDDSSNLGLSSFLCYHRLDCRMDNNYSHCKASLKIFFYNSNILLDFPYQLVLSSVNRRR